MLMTSIHVTTSQLSYSEVEVGETSSLVGRIKMSDWKAILNADPTNWLLEAAKETVGAEETEALINLIQTLLANDDDRSENDESC